MQKITVVIPTFNEENFIKGAIETSNFADEIIVIDSFSTDNTVAIAKQYNIVLLEREFDNFSSQKNFAIDKAQNNWVFLLDADERIPENLQREIMDTLKNNNESVAYEVLCSHIFMGKRMRHGTFKNEWKPRFFNKQYCRFGQKFVHEDFIINGKKSRMRNHFDHYTYRGFDHYISKKNQYAQFQAQEILNKGKKPNIFHFFIKPPFRFFNEFILRGGFLDGFQGFSSAYLNSYGVMGRYIKLWLLHHNMK